MSATTHELWRPVDGFDGYEVSNLGRVRSYRCYRHIKHRMTEPHHLKPLLGKGQRYSVVSLYDAAGRRKDRPIHILVALAFVPGKTTDRREVNHIDGDRLNNSASNLEWVSRTENMRHARATGLWTPYGAAKLTPEIVLRMRAMVADGATKRQAADAMGVNFNTATTAIAGRSWRHV